MSNYFSIALQEGKLKDIKCRHFCNGHFFLPNHEKTSAKLAECTQSWYSNVYDGFKQIGSAVEKLARIFDLTSNYIRLAQNIH